MTQGQDEEIESRERWANSPFTQRLRKQNAENTKKALEKLLAQCERSSDADVRALLVKYQAHQGIDTLLAGGKAGA